jgi:hypothetical protein
MGIVFGKNLIREEHHFAADNLQARRLKPMNYIAAMAIR